MQLLNPALLAGLGAVSIPVIIHLLNRRRFKIVRWAAMEFLLAANRQNRRRIRVEHLLVLLLRCLAIALLVLMIARPRVSSAGLAMLPGVVDPVERVVVLDDSGSMAQRTGRTSSFERAKQVILRLVKDLRETRPRDYLTVVRVSRDKTPDLSLAAPGNERTEVFLRELKDLQPSQRVFDVPLVLSRALARDDEELAQRRLVVYVLTDMRARDWIGESGQLPAKLAEVMATAPENARVVVVDVGSDARQNLGVVDFRPTEKLAQADVPLELEVRVRNYGQVAVADVPLSIESKDGRLPMAPIPLIPAGEEVVVRHRYTFPEAGAGALTVHLPEDALSMDDSRQLAVEVQDQLAVLLVDGEVSDQPLQSETDLLRLALSPPGDQNWGIEPVVLSAGELRDQDLSRFPTVIACNLERWPPERLAELKRFVARGGGLAIMLGDRVDVEQYEQTLYEGGQGLLPCRLGQRVVHATSEESPGVAPPTEGHVLTEVLRGENNPFLKRVRAKVHMTFPRDSERDAAARVLLRLDDAAGTPFVVEKPYGKGLVVLFNTTADLAWSTWPRDPSWPIIAHELVRMLAPRATEGRTLRCGEELVRPINPAQIVPTARLRLPGQDRTRELHAESIGDEEELAFRFADSGRAGVYELAMRTQAGDPRVEYFAVNVDPSEGDLRRADPARIRPALEGVALEFVRPGEEADLLALTDGEQSELWRTCLLALVVLLLIEQSLAWKAAHHYRKEDAPPLFAGVELLGGAARVALYGLALLAAGALASASRYLVRPAGLAERIPEGAESHYELGNLPRGDEGLNLLAFVLFGVLLTVWLYRREGKASTLRKVGLATARVLVFSALLAVFLEPRLAIDLERTVQGQTIVLWDTSLSMSLADRYVDDDRRAELAKAAGLSDPRDLSALTRHELAWRLTQRAKLFEGLSERNQLLVYAFEGKAERLAPPYRASGLTPDGAATDLASAVRRALEETGGRSVAAVVAITDGRINKGEGPQGVIAALEGRRIPFYAIGIGDPTPPVNLEVVDLSADPRVLLGDPLVVEATVRARGFSGQGVEAEFAVKEQGGGEASVLERRLVRFEADDKPVRLRFTFKPEKAGDLEFSLLLPAREDEPVTLDNAKVVGVKVSDDQARILLVAGSPGFEYQFLKTRLIRERTAVVSCWLQSADESFPQEGNEQLESMPRSVEELREFDAVILIDPSPDAFDAVLAAGLKSFVADTKGGLLVIPGPKNGAAFLGGVDAKPILDLLPVVPGDLTGTRVSATERWPYKATVDGVDHPATRLDPTPERCRTFWARLPGAFFSYPVRREKAGAVVLVRHEDPSTLRESGHQPLIVAQFFDGGPVVFQGTDETWRWRSVAPTIYDRYWVGMLRFLVQGRLAGGRKRVELLSDKEVYFLGEPVRVRAHAYDRSYRPLDALELRGRARVGDDEVEVVLKPAAGRGQAGWYEGVLMPPGQGELELLLRLPDDDPGAAPESLKVRVKRPDLEFSSPRLDEEVLQGIAQATSGSLVAVGDVALLPDRIPSKTEHLLVAGTPIALWDRWHTIFLVCSLLTLEWALRKRSKMV